MADEPGQGQPKKPTDWTTQIRESRKRVAETEARKAARTRGIGISSPETPSPPPPPDATSPILDSATGGIPRNAAQASALPVPSAPPNNPTSDEVATPVNMIGSFSVDPLAPAPASKPAIGIDPVAPIQKFPFITRLDLSLIHCHWSVDRGVKGSRPVSHGSGTGLDLLDAFAPGRSPCLVPQKEHVDYILPAKLNPEIDGRYRRANANVASVSPLVYDVDEHDVENVAAMAAKRGVHTFWYHSHGAGHPSENKHKARGRIIIFVSRPMTCDEFRHIHPIVGRDLLGDAYDTHAAAPSTHFGMFAKHPDDPEDDHRWGEFPGGLIDVDALLQAMPLLPPAQRKPVAHVGKLGDVKKNRLLEQAKLTGLSGLVDSRVEWITALAAINRSFGKDPEFALVLADAMSEVAANYDGTDHVEKVLFSIDPEHAGPDWWSYSHRVRRWCQNAVQKYRSSAGADNVVPLKDTIANLGPQSKLIGQSTLDPHSLAAGIAMRKPLPSSIDTLTLAQINACQAYIEHWRSFVPADQRDERGRVIMKATHAVDTDVDEIIRLLVAESEGKLFKRGSTIASVQPDGRLRRIDSVVGLESEIGRYVATWRKGKHEGDDPGPGSINFANTDINVGPTKAVLNEVLTKLPDLLPSLMSVAQLPMPVPRSKGVIGYVEKDGFDPELRVLFHIHPSLRGIAFPTKVAEPDALAAAKVIENALMGFNYLSNDDRAGTILALFIALLRPVLRTAPGIVVGAPGGGQTSGKSTLCNFFATLADPSITRGDEIDPLLLVGNFAEQTTLIHSRLGQFPPYILCDNLPLGLRFDSSAFAVTLSGSRISSRRKYAADVTAVGTNTLMLANGNGINPAGDLETRIMLIRLNLRMARKTNREDGEFIDDIIEGRAEISQALVTMFCRYEQTRHTPEMQNFLQKNMTATERNRFDPMIDTLREAAILATKLVFGVEADPFAAFDNSKKASTIHSDRVRVVNIMQAAMARLSVNGAPGGTSRASAVLFNQISSTLSRGERSDLLHITGVRESGLLEFSVHAVTTSLGMRFAGTPAGGLILHNDDGLWWVDQV